MKLWSASYKPLINIHTVLAASFWSLVGSAMPASVSVKLPTTKVVQEAFGQTALIKLSEPNWSGNPHDPDWLRALYSVVQRGSGPSHVRVTMVSFCRAGHEVRSVRKLRKELNRLDQAYLGKNPRCSDAFRAGCLVYFRKISAKFIAFTSGLSEEFGEDLSVVPLGFGYEHDGSEWIVSKTKIKNRGGDKMGNLKDCLRLFSKLRTSGRY